MFILPTEGKPTCRNCGSTTDAVSDVFGDDDKPAPGDVNLCSYCGVLSVFNDDLTIRAPSLDEMEELISDEESWSQVLKAQAAIKQVAKRIAPSPRWTQQHPSPFSNLKKS